MRQHYQTLPGIEYLVTRKYSWKEWRKSRIYLVSRKQKDTQLFGDYFRNTDTQKNKRISIGVGKLQHTQENINEINYINRDILRINLNKDNPRKGSNIYTNSRYHKIRSLGQTDD